MTALIHFTRFPRARAILALAFSAAAAAMLAACAETPEGNAHRAMPRTVLQDCNRADFDSPPVLVQGNAPDFPRVLHQPLDGGQAQVHFVVTPAGTADQISAESPGDWRFAGFAGLAVQDWHFEPAKKAGTAVAAHCSMKLDIVPPA
jgi:hypothetical protein